MSSKKYLQIEFSIRQIKTDSPYRQEKTTPSWDDVVLKIPSIICADHKSGENAELFCQSNSLTADSQLLV
ncbi:MAG: hypothetical protein MJ116_12820, partial [Lachnospiraceae bacterium]|nr:hypothetical protein [Lachnospiraceae bacterium]